MSVQDFERELAGALPEPDVDESDELEAERQEILAEARHYLGLPESAGVDVIRSAFSTSMWDFWIFFFPEYRMGEDGTEIQGGDFHRELVDELQRIYIDGRPGEELSRAYPREHAKSVFASFVGQLFALAHGHRRFAVLFSDTSTQAEEFVDDTRVEVETNERLQAVYAEFCEWDRPPKANRLAFGTGVWLVCAGSGKSVRGMRKGRQRPDLVTCDDIENDEEVENPKRRKKKMRWYNRVPRKLGRAAVFVIVGTILHASSFLAERVKADEHIHAALPSEPVNQELWSEWERMFLDRGLPDAEAVALQFYEARRAEMDAGAEVLWPAQFSIYGLMVERAEDLASFLSERQNKPFDPSASWFPEDRITFRTLHPKDTDVDELPSDEEIVLSVGFWDPARGTSKGDTSSLVRLDCYRDGSRHVRESETDRIPPENVMEAGIGMHKRRRFDVWGVEKVGLSSYDETLQTLGDHNGLQLPVEPCTPTGSKDIRIRSLRPSIVSAGLTFDSSLPLEAQRQLKFYPSHPNDDFPDAVQSAMTLADEYLTDVEPASSSRDATEEELRPDRDADLRRAIPREDEPEGLGAFSGRFAPGGLFDRLFG